ncbi:MAG: autotransporter outer membrane beta-barrel domain-containing protein [Pseudomonadota bacterium]
MTSQISFKSAILLLSHGCNQRGRVSAEQGGAAALAVSGQTDSFLFVDLAGEISRSFKMSSNTSMNTSASLGWRYEVVDNTIAAQATLADTDQAGLVAQTTDFERNRVMVGGNLSTTLFDSVDVFVKYRGEFGSNITNNRISGGVEVAF